VESNHNTLIVKTDSTMMLKYLQAVHKDVCYP